MKTQTAFLLCGLLAPGAGLTHAQGDSTITGYVSRAISASDFDVNGLRVLCTGETKGVAKSAHGEKGAAVTCPGDPPPYVGEGMSVRYSGVVIDNTVHATRIDRRPMPRPGEVSGSAVIDAPPASEEAKGSGLVLRADGYRIRITAETKIEWRPPLQSLTNVKAGDWIKYKGKLDAARVLVAASVQIGPIEIGSGEEKLREKGDYDPSAVPADAKQNYVKDVFRGGLDPKEFPPFKDAEMQARVEKIRNSLVPAYQLNLPDSGPAKINFRFQVVDNKHFCSLIPCEAFTLPNGIILVPHQIVDRMQNDSQLAAFLADGIARALERQEYRTERTIKVARASQLAAPFAPYAGLGLSSGGLVALDIQTREMQQRDRVSLTLLRDAGYEIDQAPIAWWLLASGEPKPLTDIDMPDRTAYLYLVLGELWHDPVVTSNNTNP